MTRRYRVWSPEDRAMLTMLWQTVMPVHEIAAVLERSENATTQQASLMGIKRPAKRGRRPHDWTRAEDTVLIAERSRGVPYGQICLGERSPLQMKNRIGYLRREGAI